MSTRSVIARQTGKTPKEFEGRYHHSDGYPTGLGAALWHVYRDVFKRDLTRMMSVLLDDHTGWSSILGVDWTIAAGYGGEGPACYCHVAPGVGREPEHDREFIGPQDDASQEWVYVFHQTKGVVRSIMHVFKVCGISSPFEYKLQATIDLDLAQPNWKAIEKRGYRAED